MLLGMTALAAVGLIAAPIMAADMMEGPVTVGLSGYTQGAIDFYSQDDTDNDGEDDARGNDIGYVYEFNISGSTTLDNGITVGVHAQLGRAGGGDSEPPPNGTTTDFEEMHTTLSGAFGSLRLGRTESAAFNATIPAPGAPTSSTSRFSSSRSGESRTV